MSAHGSEGAITRKQNPHGMHLHGMAHQYRRMTRERLPSSHLALDPAHIDHAFCFVLDTGHSLPPGVAKARTLVAPLFLAALTQGKAIMFQGATRQ